MILLLRLVVWVIRYMILYRNAHFLSTVSQHSSPKNTQGGGLMLAFGNALSIMILVAGILLVVDGILGLFSR